jgi:2-phospho-L-lactate/phosphoenolpyruvate guanylyltransferase
VQGTVRSFDRANGSGDVLLDDGSLLTYDRTVFKASGLRLLRVGQRVRLRCDPSGAVVFLTVATLPDPAGS